MSEPGVRLLAHELGLDPDVLHSACARLALVIITRETVVALSDRVAVLGMEINDVTERISTHGTDSIAANPNEQDRT